MTRKETTDTPLSIGRLARAAGVNVETIRFYQRRKLLAEPPRPSAGYRRYGQETVARLRFIKRAQQLGFSLEEVGHLLALEDGRSCTAARALAAQKLALVEARVADLNRMRRALKRLIARCDVTQGAIA